MAETLFGRERELREIAELLGRPACRLLTLVGPGGIGKTSLALEVAARLAAGARSGGQGPAAPPPLFSGGARVVPLGQLADPAGLELAIAEALGLSTTAQGLVRVQLCEALGDQGHLLVLDTFEHLLPGVAILGELLAAASGLKLLVTSREVLNLQEEWLYPVEGLPTGAPAGGESDAARLFAARARRVRPSFDPAAERAGVGRLVRLVEGMPLAIELAAAWARMLPAAAIADEVAASVAFLESSLRNVPERHRSVLAAFDHSWRLLSPAEREAFARLALFRGGFSREAAAQVAGAGLPTLAALVDKSLVRLDSDGRYQLHELLRQCAAQRLAEMPEARAATEAAYDSHYLGALAGLWQEVIGGDQRAALGQIAADLENIRTAWRRAIARGADELLQAAAPTLAIYYEYRGPYLDGIAELEPALAALRAAPPGPSRDRSLITVQLELGYLYVRVGQTAAGRAAFRAAEAIYAELGVGLVEGIATDPRIGLGLVALVEGDYAQAARHGEGARLRALEEGHRGNLPYCYYLLANAALPQGRLAAARQYAEEAAAGAELLGDQWFLAYCLNDLGRIAAAQGDFREARRHYRRAYALREELGDRQGMAVALNLLGRAALAEDDPRDGLIQFGRSLAIFREIADRGGRAEALAGLGECHLALGDPDSARGYLAEALSLAAAVGYTPLVIGLLVAVAELLLPGPRAHIGAALLALALRHPAAGREDSARAQAIAARYAGALAPADLGADPAADLGALIAAARAALAEPISYDAGKGGQGDKGSPSLSAETVQPTRNWAERVPPSPTPPLPLPLPEPLTEREREVLALLAGGLSNQEIADQLVLSLGTVKWYTGQIYQKLAVQSRTQAIARARELRLV